jgi:hypothetical protein
VVGTCGGEKKVSVLRQLGCDRIIDHTVEDVGSVLQREYPSGMDLVYEGTYASDPHSHFSPPMQRQRTSERQAGCLGVRHVSTLKCQQPPKGSLTYYDIHTACWVTVGCRCSLEQEPSAASLDEVRLGGSRTSSQEQLRLLCSLLAHVHRGEAGLTMALTASVHTAVERELAPFDHR